MGWIKVQESSHREWSEWQQQRVKKRCRLWLTNSALVYEPKCGGRVGVAGLPMSTAEHRSPNKLWRSISIFNRNGWTIHSYFYIQDFFTPLAGPVWGEGSGRSLSFLMLPFYGTDVPVNSGGKLRTIWIRVLSRVVNDWYREAGLLAVVRFGSSPTPSPLTPSV